MLIAIEVRMRQHARLFEQDGAAMCAWRGAAWAARRSSGHPAATASSTAMRTATPLLTWARMTDCGPSATSEAISMPRFIGCGA